MNYFSLLFFALLLLSCGDDDLSIEDLPPATQTGEHTFGCIVNGDVFVAQSSADGTNRGASYQYSPFDSTYGLTIHGSMSRDPILQIVLFTEGIEIEEKQYNFFGDGRDPHEEKYLYGEYQMIQVGNSSTFLSVTGSLNITRFDPENRVCSGTFWFDAKDEETGELVEVRDGRFDVILIL